MKKEILARFTVFGIILGVIFAVLVTRFWNDAGVVEVHATMPDQGGWLPASIHAQVGETITLRLVSDDVVHGFALGQSKLQPVDVLPGRPTEIQLSFDKPGTYTFFCTRWCGADHWRMRGTITVEGNEIVNQESPAPPLYLQLGIDLDKAHDLPNFQQTTKPSSRRGEVVAGEIPADLIAQYQTAEYYRAHSPYQVWSELRASSMASNLTDGQIWDLVAWVWQQNTTAAMITTGQALYQRDCAACHGITGGGEGIFGGADHENGNNGKTLPDGHSLEAPTNFQQEAHMFGASPALLQGKIIRGGMGTGMPSWGLIYTENQTWALVDYLWTYLFDYSVE